MAVEQIINDSVIGIIKLGIGIISLLIGALATVYTRWIISKINTINENLKDLEGSLKSSDQSFIKHIIDFHTRKDK